MGKMRLKNNYFNCPSGQNSMLCVYKCALDSLSVLVSIMYASIK